jgi:hypothetical protein
LSTLKQNIVWDAVYILEGPETSYITMFVFSHTAFTICGYVLISHHAKFPVPGYIFSSEVSRLLQHMLEMHVTNTCMLLVVALNTAAAYISVHF